MKQQRLIRGLMTGVDKRLFAGAIGALSALMAAIIGISLALLGPVYTILLAVALLIAFITILGLENALQATILVVLLLPYGTLPFKLVLTPSFLDLAMAAVYLLYFLQWISGERRRLATTPIHGLILIFMLLSIFSFVAGLRYAGLTSNRLRQFAELMLAIGITFILVDVVRTTSQVERLVQAMIAGGAIAAVIGIALWILPADQTERILVRLAPIGYPNSGVIHYIEDNPDLSERATGTSVDPNSFGGVLVVVTALTASLATCPKAGVAKRWLLIAAFALMTICLMLTFSRGAMMALGVAIVTIGLIGDRRLLIVAALGVLVVLLLPMTQGYVERFVLGFQQEDLATKMRLGEYKDALILVGRYPLLGVGFTGTPDIDIYLGVANLYLTIASNMGILGLGAFILLMGTILVYAWSARNHMGRETGDYFMWLGLLAGIVTVLAGGMFDHYFFNLEFFHASTIMWMFVGLLLAMTRMSLQPMRPTHPVPSMT